MKRLLTIFLGAIGGIIVLTVAVVLLPAILPQRVDEWSIAGFAATMAGVMAALLAIIGAGAVAFNWIYLEKRVERVLTEKTEAIRDDLFASLRERIRGMGDFVLIWQLPVNEREEKIEEVLRRAPDTPNVAAMMAEDYITSYTFSREVEKQRLYAFIKRSKIPVLPTEAALSFAEFWAQRALDAQQSHDPGYPEYVMAKIRALQKEPDGALQFLRAALKKSPALRGNITLESADWQIFTGMTHGESQVKKLDDLLKLIGAERPSLEDVKIHCNHRDNMQRVAFAAVQKKNGDYFRVVVIGVQTRADDPALEWSVSVDEGFRRGASDLDGIIKIINDEVIPTGLIPNQASGPDYSALANIPTTEDEQ